MSYRFCGCLPATEAVWHIPGAVCTVLDSLWWTERSKHVECFYQNKINLRYCGSGWFYYRNDVFVLWCVPCGILLAQIPANVLLSLSLNSFAATYTFWRLPCRHQRLQCVVAMKRDAPKCCVTIWHTVPYYVSHLYLFALHCAVLLFCSFWDPPRRCQHINVISKTVVEPYPSSRPVARELFAPTTNLVVSTRNVQNIKDIHADQHAKKHATLCLIPCVASVKRA
jgi:hypothetical protein